MIIQQLSIFLNNKIGRFTEVTDLLAKANINLKAFTLSEMPEFGIVRLITDNNQKAIEALQAEFYAVNTTEVVLFEMADEAGSLAKILAKLSAANINVEYMYAFTRGNVASVVIRTDNIALSEEIIAGM